MNTIQQILRGINLGANTRVIVPYALNKDTLYQAWYDVYRVLYDTANETVILVDNDENIHTPIIYAYDRYHNQLTTIFERPADDRKTHNQRAFVRITVLRKYFTEHIDAQGPLFIITELDTPSY